MRNLYPNFKIREFFFISNLKPILIPRDWMGIYSIYMHIYFPMCADLLFTKHVYTQIT